MDLSTNPPDSPGPPHREHRGGRSLRLGAGGLAVAIHLALLVLILAGSPTPRPQSPEPEPPPFVTVMVAPRPPPPPPPPRSLDQPAGSPPRAAPAASPPKPAEAAKVATPLRPRPPRATPPPQVERLVASPAASEPNVVLGESDLAGATVAGTGGGTGGSGGGSGAGDGGCDMVRRLQDALRRDPEVTAAVTRSHRALGAGGKAILVWNGEWLRSPGQAGKGLAGVRQAIAMEVAFAPEACRAQTMRGLVVISFNDRSDAPRLALGGRQWRWTELLSARR